MNFVINIALTAGKTIAINEISKLVEYLKNEFVKQWIAGKIKDVSVKYSSEKPNVGSGEEKFIPTQKGFLNNFLSFTGITLRLN